MDPILGNELVNYPVIPTFPSAGYVISNADGSYTCIMPDGTIIYYDKFGQITGRYP